MYFNPSFEKPVVIGPMGRCIYGKDHATSALTREHVIPFGLGGGLILRDATCENCRKITHSFESTCLERHLKAVRTHEKMPSRNRKRRPTHLPILVERDGIERPEMVPIDHHPTLLILPEYLDAPGMIGARPAGHLRERDHVFHKKNDPALKKVRALLEGRSFAVDNKIHGDCYARMLAKIAHGMMVAAYGLDNVAPFLLDIILRGDLSKASYFIGRDDTDLTGGARRGVGANHMAISLVKAKAGPWPFIVAVNLRLFAHIPETPSYLLMAGAVQQDLPINSLWRPHLRSG